ncbi:head maturation protease, ClpP-related [Lysinibacillus capsici]|uniref:head maturation protease, ClpP-related n=1 Tax=Lysinibacillus capsici TaxID=2115968 RepID=UPI0032E478B3
MKIEVKGPIISDSDQWIYDWFEIPATSPSKVNMVIEQAIRSNVNELIVEINSGGGSVFAGAEIWTALKSFAGTIKVRIVGLAASAASVIAMAGTKIEMSPVAQIMIHNASTRASGDYRAMYDAGELLESVNQSLMSTYIMRTKLPEAELKMMMDKETWMNAQQAKELGFIDNIMFEQEIDAVADANSSMLVNGALPQAVIDKMRQELANDPIRNVVNTSAVEPPIDNQGGTPMTLEELQNKHPELFNQVKQTGYDEGVKAENERIKAIEEIAPVGNDALVQAAKFDKPVTAEQLAVQIVKNQKEAGAAFYTNAQQDAEQLQDISGEQAPENQASSEQKFTAGLMNVWGGNKQ